MPWQEVYAELTPEPIAAASLGQARLLAQHIACCETCVCSFVMPLLALPWLLSTAGHHISANPQAAMLA